LVSPLWIAAYFGGDAIPCWSHVDGFMVLVVRDAIEFTSYASETVGLSANHHPMRLAAYRFVGLWEGA